MDSTRGVEIDRLRRDIDMTRAAVSRTAGELREKVGEAMRWQTYVRDYPVPVLAGASLIGLIAGRRLAQRFGTPAPFDTLGGDQFAAVRESRVRLASRVETLVNRVIDEVAEATERALVPALVGGVQAFFEDHGIRGVTRRRVRDGMSGGLGHEASSPSP